MSPLQQLEVLDVLGCGVARLPAAPQLPAHQRDPVDGAPEQREVVPAAHRSLAADKASNDGSRRSQSRKRH